MKLTHKEARDLINETITVLVALDEDTAVFEKENKEVDAAVDTILKAMDYLYKQEDDEFFIDTSDWL